jgi:hypothetical protein
MASSGFCGPVLQPSSTLELPPPRDKRPGSTTAATARVFLEPDQAATPHARIHILGSSCRIAAPESAVSRSPAACGYVRDAIGAIGGAVLLDLVGLGFCDAGGLGVLAPMSRYAPAGWILLASGSAAAAAAEIIGIAGLDGKLPVHRGDLGGQAG